MRLMRSPRSLDFLDNKNIALARIIFPFFIRLGSEICRELYSFLFKISIKYESVITDVFVNICELEHVQVIA